ncbi:MAG: DUF1080 domain-containing protein [Paludibacter sp.]|nr:DUF1080 domain-containing protein [Paludibacter sp.]
MKTNIKILFVIVLFLESALTIVQAGNSKKQKIFSSSDAVNWEYIIKDASLNPQDVFKMDNGTLKISGISSGYLRTKKSYSNYTLKLEWRWTKSLGNSGVLVHIQPKDTIWPVCFQVQQKEDAAGDIICMNGVWARECTDSVKFTVMKMNASNEKTLGEWNAMKVICKKSSITVFVNGVLQNKISGLTVNKGYIGFQNEGIPIEFRNVIISKL